MFLSMAVKTRFHWGSVIYHAQAATTKIAEWRFDEGNGTTTKETVGNTSDPIHYVFNNAVYKPLSPRSGERMASPIVHYYLMDTQHG